MGRLWNDRRADLGFSKERSVMEHLDGVWQCATHLFQHWNVTASMATFTAVLVSERLGWTARIVHVLPHRHKNLRIVASQEVVMMPSPSATTSTQPREPQRTR